MQQCASLNMIPQKNLVYVCRKLISHAIIKNKPSDSTFKISPEIHVINLAIQ